MDAIAVRADTKAAAAAPALDHVEAWLFDLDNTLYPAQCDLFKQVDVRIGEYIAQRFKMPYDQARFLQKSYFRGYGTTMRGLMTEYGIDPVEFLDFVHHIDHSPVEADPRLDRALAALPGAKYVFTNASVPHSEKVLARLGIRHHFVGIFDIVAAEYDPKPHDAFYDRFFARHVHPPEKACLFEDMAKNLLPAHARGMTTVLIETDNDYNMTGHEGDYIHHRTRDLAGWLEGVIAARVSPARP